MSRIARVVALAAVLTAGSSVPALAAAPQPFGHACAPRASTLFCPAVGDAQRVPSFDGVPIDVDVTLPATGDGPFPTLVMLHGFGGSKGAFESVDPAAQQRYNSTAFAQRGYAVVTPSIRGFGRSCGTPSSRTPDCANGYIRLADQRYEARDVQELLGRLVDERVADPARLAVTGQSYGGGLSMSLAYLKDRIRLPDGSYAPWRSPSGTGLSIRASAPIIPWSDLSAALVPNGRFRDTIAPTPTLGRSPAGVPLKAFTDLLYAAALGSGFVAPAGVNPAADLTGWKARLDAGEPFTADVGVILREIFTHHSALGVTGGKPAPLHISQGWTDELFPVDQALRAYNDLREDDPDAEVTLDLGDFGHPRATNPARVLTSRHARIASFLDARLKPGTGAAPRVAKPGSVTATLTECRSGVAPTVVRASSYERLHPGQLSVSGTGSSLSLGLNGGRDETGAALAPVGGAASSACGQLPYRGLEPRTAHYLVPLPRPVTLLGSPTISARVRVRGSEGQLAARLWDVDRRTRTQRLVSRGVFRLERGTNRILFQLSANGYRFAARHTIRLELLDRDAPSFRANDTAFSARVELTRLQIPTRERASRARGTTRFSPLGESGGG